MNELKLVKGGPEKRRQAYTDILQAQAQINLGDYSEAACSAASSLLTFQEINSVRHIYRVEKIFQQLLKSPYKNSPDVGHLDYLLHYKRGS